MKKLFLFLVISVLAFCFAACGDETASIAADNQYQQQSGGTVVKRSFVRQPQTIHRPVFKKRPQLPPLNTQTWPMVATGQTECYDNMQKVDCDGARALDFDGQDGKKRYGTRSITKDPDNAEILKDSVTKLVWTKKVNTDLSWFEAKNYCDNLKLSNKTWRLPTTAELKTIINYGKTSPAIDTVFYEVNGSTTSSEALEMKDQLNNWFWAARHVHFNSESSKDAASWIINFTDGFVEYTSRYNKYNVRCVSSNF